MKICMVYCCLRGKGLRVVRNGLDVRQGQVPEKSTGKARVPGRMKQPYQAYPDEDIYDANGAENRRRPNGPARREILTSLTLCKYSRSKCRRLCRLSVRLLSHFRLLRFEDIGPSEHNARTSIRLWRSRRSFLLLPCPFFIPFRPREWRPNTPYFIPPAH